MKEWTALLLFGALLAAPYTAVADIPSRYTNDNLFTSEHDRPVSLYQDGSGGFFGYTENGFRFTQQPVTNEFGIRLHKFTIDEAYFYMSDKGLIEANSDLAAISIYLARA